MGIGGPNLVKAEPAIESPRPVLMQCAKDHGNASPVSLLNGVSDDGGADAPVLILRGHDQFSDVNILGPVLEADVAAGPTLAQQDLEGPAGPVAGEEVILLGLVPDSELGLHDPAKGLMVHRSGPVGVGICGRAAGQLRWEPHGSLGLLARDLETVQEMAVGGQKPLVLGELGGGLALSLGLLKEHLVSLHRGPGLEEPDPCAVIAARLELVSPVLKAPSPTAISDRHPGDGGFVAVGSQEPVSPEQFLVGVDGLGQGDGFSSSSMWARRLASLAMTSRSSVVAPSRRPLARSPRGRPCRVRRSGTKVAQ
jgi:hypothetical protein